MKKHGNIVGKQAEYIGVEELPTKPARKQVEHEPAPIQQTQIAPQGSELIDLVEKVAEAFDRFLKELYIPALVASPTFFALRTGLSTRFLTEALLPEARGKYLKAIIIPYVRGFLPIEKLYPSAKRVSIDSIGNKHRCSCGDVFCA